MPRSIRACLNGLALPELCAACGEPATQRREVVRVFTFGNRRHRITLPVPLCAGHFESAQRKSPAEAGCGRAGLGVGAVVGLACAGALFASWQADAAPAGTGGLALRAAVAAFVALAGCLIVWSGTLLWVAPRFAHPETKAARDAVRLVHFWPGPRTVEFRVADARRRTDRRRPGRAGESGRGEVTGVRRVRVSSSH